MTLKYLDRYNNDSNAMPVRVFALLACLAVCFMVWQLVMYHGVTLKMPDTYSYFRAWDMNKTLHTDPVRPPVYVFFVGILRDLTGTGAARVIVALAQWAAYVAVLPLAWQLCRHLGAGPRVSTLATTLYLLVPGMWVCCNMMLPESFTGSIIILLMWLTDITINDGHHRRAMFWSVITLLILIFTKPAMLFLLPVMAVIWIYVALRARQRIIRPLVYLAGIAITLCGYCAAMRHTYLVAAPAKTADWNCYIQLRMAGLIRPDDISDADNASHSGIRERVSRFYDEEPGKWSRYVPMTYWEEIYRYNWPELHWLNKNAIEHHRSEIPAVYLKNIERSANTPLLFEIQLPDEMLQQGVTWNGIDRWELVSMIYPLWWVNPPLWAGWAIVLSFVALWLWRWWRSRRFQPLAFTVGATLTLGYLSAILGAPDDWARLTMPVNMLLPVTIASVVALIAKGHRHVKC